MIEISPLLLNKLKDREDNNSLRKLVVNNNYLDFWSNDYLGFAKNKDIYNNTKSVLDNIDNNINGSTGSRLLSGNSSLYDQTESLLSEYHNSESALLFQSGYAANMGFFGTIPQKGDFIIYDSLVHTSIREGIRLSYAKSFGFKHNDTNDLLRKISKSSGNVYIVIESIYSMDGDIAPLKEITEIAQKNNAFLIVDEAHSGGVYGDKGEGLVKSMNLENKIFARIHTFGKAIGCHGAVVLGSEKLKQYLINFCKPFIYTTAMSAHSLANISSAYNELKTTKEIIKLTDNISFFRSQIKLLNLEGDFISSESPIQCLKCNDINLTKNITNSLKLKGYLVSAILSPTVSKGAERIRICLHSYNTTEEIKFLLENIKNELNQNV
ncbi:MAG: pyridoxal phosphate-dependent aminotransferase family protein [Flavobacteriaceae bacterium]|nr:pyridoxal phosphate-dependent aminotransferase family protein [Flavobacteriaceae bacterium]